MGWSTSPRQRRSTTRRLGEFGRSGSFRCRSTLGRTRQNRGARRGTVGGRLVPVALGWGERALAFTPAVTTEALRLKILRDVLRQRFEVGSRFAYRPLGVERLS